MALVRPLGSFALGQFGTFAVAGELAAIETADAVVLIGRVAHAAILAATEGDDTALFKTLAAPTEKCQPRTVCFVASKGDSDTVTCRDWGIRQHKAA